MRSLRAFKKKLSIISRLRKEEDYATALAEVESALNIWPGNARLHVLRAKLVQLTEDPIHDLDDAKQALMDAAQFDERSPAAAIELGYFRDNIKDDPHAASRVYSKAVVVARHLLVDGLIGQAKAAFGRWTRGRIPPLPSGGAPFDSFRTGFKKGEGRRFRSRHHLRVPRRTLPRHPTQGSLRGTDPGTSQRCSCRPVGVTVRCKARRIDMEWEGREEESSNVERSARGQGVKLGVAGGGVALLILLAGWFFGVDTTQLAEIVGGAWRKAIRKVSRPRRPVNPQEEKMAKFSKVKPSAAPRKIWTNPGFSNSRQDLRRSHTRYFTPIASTPRWREQCRLVGRPAARLRLRARSTATPGRRIVYLDLSFFHEMETKFSAPGEFARAYVIAHEVGHHVQHLLGYSARAEEMVRGGRQTQNQASVRLELQADYFAGVCRASRQGHVQAQRSRHQNRDPRRPRDRRRSLAAKGARPSLPREVHARHIGAAHARSSARAINPATSARRCNSSRSIIMGYECVRGSITLTDHITN